MNDFGTQDLDALLHGDLADAGCRLVLADFLEENGDDEAAGLFRVLDAALRAPLAAREALRKSGKIEPQNLRVHECGEWCWGQYRALPGHARPGSAGRGYSYPENFLLLPRTDGRDPHLKAVMARVNRTAVAQGIAGHRVSLTLLRAVRLMLDCHGQEHVFDGPVLRVVDFRKQGP